MANLGPLNFLRIPLANLWDEPAIRQRIEQDGANFGVKLSEWYCSYDPNERLAMRTQLEWATQNPTYDFKNMLTFIRTSNEDISFYFAWLLNIIEQEGCSDDTTAPPATAT